MLRNVAVGDYPAREFVRVLDEGSVFEIALQAYFLYTSISADEKLATALSGVAGTNSAPIQGYWRAA